MIQLEKKFNEKRFNQTAQLLKAMGHPIRIAILNLLLDGTRKTVTEIHTSLGLEQAVVSQHLSILRTRGVVDSTRKGKNSYYFIQNTSYAKVVELAMRNVQIFP